jgi:hypothetical protein
MHGPDSETFEPGSGACGINENGAIGAGRYSITVQFGGEVAMGSVGSFVDVRYAEEEC